MPITSSKRQSVVSDESGATMVIFAILLIVLLLFAGLAIDVPVARNERRQAQNAADHAALAAAYAKCTGSTEAQALVAAQNSVAANGYSSPELSLTVEGSGGYKATITTTSDTVFASIIGYDVFNVGATATADCTGGPSASYAIFALGNTCVKQIDVSGSTSIAFGGVHSNGNLYSSGSGNDFGAGNGEPPTDVVTYVTNDPGGVPLMTDAGYPLQTGVKEAPLSFDIAHYRPGGAAAVTAAALGEYYDFSGTDILGQDIVANGDGLYYTDQKIDIGDSGLDYTVTLVAETDDEGIKISGSNVTLVPYVDGLLAFSTMDHSNNDDKCSKFSISMSGGSNAWEGIVYAPEGLIEMAGSSNSTLTGSLLGYTIRLNGSDISIEADPDLFPDVPLTRLTF